MKARGNYSFMMNCNQINMNFVVISLMTSDNINSKIRENTLVIVLSEQLNSYAFLVNCNQININLVVITITTSDTPNSKIRKKRSCHSFI